MSGANNNSSLPLLLGITGVVVMCVGGGWFLLDNNDRAEAPANEPAFAAPVTRTRPEPAPETDSVPDLEMDLRKARMAAQSDLLAFPGEQSALHFYSRVLLANPEHEPAKAEFDDVLDRIGEQVSRQLRAENFDDAYGLARQVAAREPDHPLVRQTQATLDNVAGALADQALRAARDGSEEDANRVFSSLAAMPGRDAEQLSSLRDSIVEITEARSNTEAQKRQIEDQAEQARNNWLARFNRAMASGRLIAPPGNNARDFLAGNDVPADMKVGLTSNLVTALMKNSQNSLGTDDIERAEALLQVAVQLGGNSDKLALLSDDVHDAYIRREESRVRPARELSRIKNVPAKYPLRAAERGTTGWVELEFTVTPTGETVDIEVIQAEPADVFDTSAVEAASQWVFEPQEFRGEPINQRVMTKLVFRQE